MMGSCDDASESAGFASEERDPSDGVVRRCKRIRRVREHHCELIGRSESIRFGELRFAIRRM